MGLLDTLVVGVDASDASRSAVTWAADHLARGGSLNLVHAQQPNRARQSVAGSCEAGQLLADERGRLSLQAGNETLTQLLAGDPTTALLATADAVDADAIVVGPHSASVKVGALGRVTRRLLQRASQPVVVAKSSPRFNPGPPIEPKSVVACVGYGDATEQAAIWASDYATELQYPLTLLHVVGYRPLFPADSPSEMLASYLGGDMLQSWAKEDLKEVRDRIGDRHPELVITAVVEVGRASKAVVAASHGAEIVVLGKRQDPALRHFVSPRIHRLIASADCSVAVVPSRTTEL